MIKLIYWSMLMLLAVSRASGLPRKLYDEERTDILEAEAAQALGGHLRCSPEELVVNDILMRAKRDELQRGFQNPSKFGPAQNFLDSQKFIKNSPVFNLIREIPKGAVLHAHSTAMVSDQFIFENITHRDDLYVCDDEKKFVLRFFRRPSDDCDWKSLKNLRNDPTTGKSIDSKILQKLTMKNIGKLKKYDDVNDAWKKFDEVFAFTSPLLKYRPVLEDYFYRGLRELYEDNVIYLELRAGLGPVYDLDGNDYTSVDVARIFRDVADRFVRDHPKFVGVKLIYAPAKTTDADKFDEYLRTIADLKKSLPDFFVGFDVVGQEDASPTIFDWIEKFNGIAGNVSLFFHAGETNWNGFEIDENLIDAVLLNAKRIGHGYALTKHPKVMEKIKERKIAIEICPISNQVLNLVEDLRNHPASVLFADDFPIVVSNDDPGLWGAKALSYDFYEAFMGIMSAHSDIRAIKQLAINSIEYSTLNPTEKSRAMSIWNQQWNAFLRNYQ